MGDVETGGCLGHSNHKMTGFDSRRNNEGGPWNCCVGLPEGRLWPICDAG